jgi:hypothetical protein
MVRDYGHLPCAFAMEDSLGASNAICREDRSLRGYELGSIVGPLERVLV